jgi:hypothetical protein
MYGSKFTSVFGEQPSETWGRVLHDMNAEDIGRGLSACIDREDKFPPDAIEFRKLCRPKKVKSHQEFLSLPKLTTKEQRIVNIKKFADLVKKWMGTNVSD